MDRDMINIVHYLYHHGRISDDATKKMLQCYADTTDPLKNSKILEISGNDWKLSEGVGDFLRLAEENLQSFPPQDWVFSFPLRVPPPQPNAPRDCFVLMPYGKAWYQRVYDAIAKAARSARYTCTVAKDIASSGGVMRQVWDAIRKSDAIVADLTENNPNVLYETGMAHALGKEVVLITQDVNTLPFDLRALRCVPYQEAALSGLERELQLFLENVPRRY
jgi:hypothetical protein